MLTLVQLITLLSGIEQFIDYIYLAYYLGTYYLAYLDNLLNVPNKYLINSFN